jgi:hypothetical protein
MNTSPESLTSHETTALLAAAARAALHHAGHRATQ